MRVFTLLLFLMGATACAGPFPASSARPVLQNRQTITVLAAASLADPFTEIGEAFSARHPGTTIVLNVAGSQQLAHQIVQGAPGDVFASANERQMTSVAAEGLTAAPPRLFASNHLAVALAPGNPAGIHELQDLALPAVRLVWADKTVPAGRYAHTFLNKAKDDERYGPAFRQAVLANIVSNEQNVRTVLTKVSLGEADAGIVYASDLMDSDLPRIEIPLSLNVDAAYMIAPLRTGEHPDLAASFVDFVLSPSGQAILLEYGFLAVSQR